MTERVGHVWRIKPGRRDDYLRMHATIWPETEGPAARGGCDELHHLSRTTPSSVTWRWRTTTGLSSGSLAIRSASAGKRSSPTFGERRPAGWLGRRLTEVWHRRLISRR